MFKKVMIFSIMTMLVSAIVFMGCSKRTGGSSKNFTVIDDESSDNGGVSSIDSNIKVIVLTPGIPITDYIDEVSDVNWYSVEMVEGATYCVQTFNLSSDMDTVLFLLDVDGLTVLTENDNCNEEHLHSGLCFVAPASGVYYILVTHVNSEDFSGIYDLIVQEFLDGEHTFVCYHADNGVGNGEDPQPKGDPPINDGPGTSPGDPGNN